MNCLSRLWVAACLLLAAGGCGSGTKGANGEPGKDGAPGKDGVACWDLDANGQCDPATEDVNADGKCDVADCNAVPGKPGAACWDLDANGQCDIATEDLNADGKCDVADCQGGPGKEGEPGKDGEPGKSGDPGKDGIACWDLDGNGQCDQAAEDKNADGKCDAADCQGGPGEDGVECWDLDGNGNCDLATEDRNADGACDALDCAGKDGVDGKDGEPGKDGLPCWDLDGNGECDLGTEDTNEDGKCDALDCAGAKGLSCSVKDNGDGTGTISCEDGSTATVKDGLPGKDGVDGKDGISCTVDQNENDTPHNPGAPTGAYIITYEVKEVTLDATFHPVITFRIMKDGAPLDIKNPPADLTGGPSFLLAYAQPQAGIAAPSDYNNLGRTAAQPLSVSVANIKAGTAGTLAGPDANGYFVATLTGTNAFPSGAAMRAVALQGYFSQKAFNGGADLPRHTISVIKPVTGDAVRREVTDSAKCANCHEWFEGHGGNRVYTVGVCVACHVPNLSTGGRGADPATVVDRLKATGSYDALVAAGYTATDPLTFPEAPNNLKDLIHGIHGAESRTVPFREVRDRGASGVFYYDFSEVTFPGHPNHCLTCHKPGTYDADLPAGVLATTNRTTTGNDKTFNDVLNARKTVPNNTDLVTTPGASTCAGCHNSTTATAHMTQNGAAINLKRGMVK